MIRRVCKTLMALFLLVCIGVHIKGLLAPFSTEPMWSHIVHTISYTICLVSILRPFSWAWVAYTMGAVYPFLYHARCAWSEYDSIHRVAVICVLVVLVMPAGGLLTRPHTVKAE